MRALVCGGRHFHNEVALEKYLDMLHAIYRIDFVMHGDNKGFDGKPGADALADNWAFKRHIPCKPYPADWDRYGKPGGPIRNKQMLDEGKPDVVVAFPGGKGTRNMLTQAIEAHTHKRGVRIIIDLSSEHVRKMVIRQWQALTKAPGSPPTGSTSDTDSSLLSSS
jgi:hypothetical protein